MTVYLGWDIGIKNLAYCLIKDVSSENGQKTKLKILKWGVINIYDASHIEDQKNKNIFYIESRPTVKCTFPNSRTGNSCNKKATYIFKNNTSRGVCGIHVKKYLSDNLYSCKGVPKCQCQIRVKSSKGEKGSKRSKGNKNQKKRKIRKN